MKRFDSKKLLKTFEIMDPERKRFSFTEKKVHRLLTSKQTNKQTNTSRNQQLTTQYGEISEEWSLLSSSLHMVLQEAAKEPATTETAMPGGLLALSIFHSHRMPKWKAVIVRTWTLRGA